MQDPIPDENCFPWTLSRQTDVPSAPPSSDGPLSLVMPTDDHTRFTIENLFFLLGCSAILRFRLDYVFFHPAIPYFKWLMC